MGSMNEFGGCKTALLRDIGAIQGLGTMICLDAESGEVVSCSENVSLLFGKSADQILERSAVLPIRDLVSPSRIEHEGLRVISIPCGGEEREAVLHRSGKYLMLEIGPSGFPDDDHWWDYATRTLFLRELSLLDDQHSVSDFIVRWVFQRSGYDRVMMYRFLANWDGEVTHEMCRPGTEGYLGLRFPSTDIPENARRLFLLNRQRVIMDVDASNSRIVALQVDPRDIDLTGSWLRAAHPTHLQYLKNMGVRASLTLSVVVHGNLWGMIACHHRDAFVPAFLDRTGFEEMIALVSFHLGGIIKLNHHDARSNLLQGLSPLFNADLQETDPKLFLAHHLGTIRRSFGASGAWMHFQGNDFQDGRPPNEEARAALRGYWTEKDLSGVGSTSSVPTEFTQNIELVTHSSGSLFLTLGGEDFIILLRPEVLETVQWAGKPQSLEDDPNAMLTPRGSFACWAQSVHGKAQPWSESELLVSEELRRSILQHIQNALLAHTANQDALTGLGNRRMFERRLLQEIRRTVNSQTRFAVHLIDLDRFKEVNDTYGHPAGDEVLRQCAERLSSMKRKEDTLTRLGGDEFAFIQTGVQDQAAELVTNRIVELLCSPIHCDGETLHIGASVGTSLCPDHGMTQDELVECADVALYTVKRAGRNGSAIYDGGRMKKGEAGGKGEGEDRQSGV